jgi:hypothetical protein
MPIEGEEMDEVETDSMNPGGGSGGDAEMDDNGNQVHSAQGTYQVGGNQVVLVARKNIPPAPDGPSRIVLLASGGVPGAFMDDGLVAIRGTKGVRITTGPPAMPMLTPDTSVDDTNGVDVLVPETQKIHLQRGLAETDCQQIRLETQSIYIDAGRLGSLTLAAGMSSIIIDASGIRIIGLPMVNINPGPPPPEMPSDIS